MSAYEVHYNYDDPEDGMTLHPDSPMVVEAEHEDDAVSAWMNAEKTYPNGSYAMALVRVSKCGNSEGSK